jgi:predicted transcriptional regulator
LQLSSQLQFSSSKTNGTPPSWNIASNFAITDITDNQIFAAYLTQPDFARSMLDSEITTHISNSRGNYTAIKPSTHAIKVADTTSPVRWIWVN